MMKRIVEIINKEPYKITCKWNDDSITTIDLYEFIVEKSKNATNSYAQLMNKDRFLQVQCDGTTFYWENGITCKDVDGTSKLAPLDIAPELLYDFAHNFTSKTQ